MRNGAETLTLKSAVSCPELGLSCLPENLCILKHGNLLLGATNREGWSFLSTYTRPQRNEALDGAVSMCLLKGAVLFMDDDFRVLDLSGEMFSIAHTGTYSIHSIEDELVYIGTNGVAIGSRIITDMPVSPGWILERPYERIAVRFVTGEWAEITKFGLIAMHHSIDAHWSPTLSRMTHNGLSSPSRIAGIVGELKCSSPMNL